VPSSGGTCGRDLFALASAPLTVTIGNPRLSGTEVVRDSRKAGRAS
jgi:hypothetical protein